MASSGQDIQTHEGGIGYKHWATELTLEKILDILKSQGSKAGDIDALHKALDELNDSGKVDTVALRNVLANLKQGTTTTKERDKAAEETQKKQEGFWTRSTNLGRQAANAFKDANIKEHLKGAGDMFLMPVDSISDAFVKVAGVVGAFGAGMANAAKLAIDKLKIFSGKLGTALKGAMGMVGWIAGAASTIVGGLLGAIEQLGDSFFDLYDTGINFAKGLSDSESGLGKMAMAAANARLTVGEFAEFVTNNARVAVAIGAESMGALSNSVRTALYPLGNLGLTAAETNEHLGEYLELQRTLGVLDTLTRAQQAKASSDYLVNLTLLAQITGKRRKQIAADMKQAMENTALNAWMFSLEGDARAKAMKSTEAVTGVLAALNPEAAEAFNEGLGRGSMGMTDWGRTMMRAGFTTEMAAQDELIAKIKSGEMSEEAGRNEILRIQRMMRANGPAMQQLHALAIAGDAGAQAAVNHMKSLQGAELAQDKWSKKLGGAEQAIGSWDEMQRSVSQTWTNFIAGLFDDPGFNKTINKFATDLKGFLKPDGDFAKSIATFAKDAGPAIVKAFTTIKNAMPGVTEWIEKLPETLESLWNSFQAAWIAMQKGVEVLRNLFFEKVETGPGGMGEEKWVAKDMGKVVGEMWDKAYAHLVQGAKDLPWGKIALAIAGIFAGKALISAVTGGIASKLAGAVSGGSKAAAGMPKAPGATMGGALGKNIGGFVGGIGEGVLKGAAAGLAAFGGPQSGKIILGATALGLAIAAIATGIGAAAWILGKTVGPFAETLKKFENVDGDALVNTGTGMKALGAGLAYLGGGQIVKAIGNLFSGGSNPFDQVELFSNATFDKKKIETNAESLVAFSTAMEKLPAFVEGNRMGGWFGAIATAFAGDVVYPWDQVKTFANANMGKSDKLEANAKAMTLFSKALTGFPEIDSERVGGAFGLMDKIFGKKTSPWGQLKEFGDTEINAEGVKSNAEAMKAFADALKDFPTIPMEKIGQAWGWLGGFVSGKQEPPWAVLKLFGEADIPLQAVTANANSLIEFSKSIEAIPTQIMDRLVGVGEAIKALSGSARANSVTGTTIQRKRAPGNRAAATVTDDQAKAAKAEWVPVGDVLENLGIDAEMLTSANNRETILGEIKVLLEDLNTLTKDAKTGAEKSAKKQTSAIAAANPYIS